MAGSLLPVCKKLMKAINTQGYRLTFSTKEFVGIEGNHHNLYTISNAEWNSERRRYENKEMYSSASSVRMVMYLRDFWYILNGMPLPDDQELWNKIRADLIEKGNVIYGQYRA